MKIIVIASLVLWSFELFLGRDIGAFQLKPESVLALEKVRRSEKSRKGACEVVMNLSKGAAAIQVNRMARDSRYEIKFPNGVFGVRGKGSYQVNADGTASAKRGSIVLAFQKGDSVVTQVIRP